jgi:hypothetical protein
MTQYFDSMAEALVKLRTDSSATRENIDEIDEIVVFDVSVCTELPDFPQDLGVKVNETVLKYTAACQPVNKTAPCYLTYQQHIRGILSMVSDLHTIFHELAERQLKGFGDDPRTPLRILYSRAEEKREALV